MPIPVNQLTDKQLLEVLSYTEGHFPDLKAKEIKPSKLTESVSAFANADGGELYIGIAENVTLPFPHKWDGFAEPEDANAHVQFLTSFSHLEKTISIIFCHIRTKPV
jgi:ATP-dependent DNA helicase RecG